MLFAAIVSILVYIRSFSVRVKNKDLRELAKCGQYCNFIYDFYIGRELSPRVTLPVFREIDISNVATF